MPPQTNVPFTSSQLSAYATQATFQPSLSLAENHYLRSNQSEELIIEEGSKAEPQQKSARLSEFRRHNRVVKQTSCKISIPFENVYADDYYKFAIAQGNNSNLIRKAMQRREWWIEIQPNQN